MRQAAPRALHQGTQRRDRGTENRRMSAHAFIANHAHLQSGMAINRCQHRDETLGRKIYVADALPFVMQDAAQNQFDRGAIGEDTITFLGGQSREQTIG